MMILKITRVSIAIIFLLNLTCFDFSEDCFAGDVSSPVLQDLSFTPSGVDLTTGSQTVTVDVTVQDDTGVDYIYVRLKNPSGSIWKENFFYPKTSFANVSWDISVFEQSAEGMYSIEYVTLRDTVGNTANYYPTDIQALGFPVGFNVINPNADISPPVLQSLSLTPSGLDLTTGSQTVTVDVTVQDETGVDYIYVRLKNPSGNVWKANSFYPKTSPASVTWDISVFEQSAEGMYSIEYIILRDTVGNTTSYYPSDIQALGFPASFNVINPNADASPPVLQNLSFTPFEVDLTTGSQTVTVDVTVQDEIGVDYIYVRLKNPSGNVWKANSFYPKTPSASVAWDIEMFEQSAEGMYSIEYITLRDTVGNTTSYYPTDIQALGFPVGFNVINPNVDTSPPVLQNLSFTPFEVDLTTGSQTVTVGVTVQDEIGVDYIYVRLKNPSGNVWKANSFYPKTPSVSVAWDIAMFEQSVEGMYSIEYITLRDTVGNTTSYYPTDIQALGFSAGFNVFLNN